LRIVRESFPILASGNTPGTADRASQVLNERIIADALIEI
jgi:hypothetical protein